MSLFTCRFLLPISYLLNPFLPPVSERDYTLSANFLLWSSYHNNLSCACHIPVNNTKTFIKCLYHFAISDIYCHMTDVLISSVACKTVKDVYKRQLLSHLTGIFYSSTPASLYLHLTTKRIVPFCEQVKRVNSFSSPCVLMLLS